MSEVGQATLAKSRVVKARHDYLPFGEETGAGIGSRTSAMGYGVADLTRQRFTSKERDQESGLDYFLARYYSASQGRFASVDPENLGASLSDPQSWNGYAYARNNPALFVDPDGLEYKVVTPDGRVEIWSDKEARETFLNPQWLNDVGYRVEKTKEDGWIAGTIYNSEGQVVATFVRTGWDDLSPFANKVFDQADKMTHDPVTWATIGVLKRAGRILTKGGTHSAVRRNRNNEQPFRTKKTPSLDVDATGKVHGELPKEVPKNWTREQLQESRDALRNSIQRRKQEQFDLGEEGRHRRRIGEEERLLRKIEKKISGS